MGFRPNREVTTELFRLTGAMPYLGDQHTCEFFSCYINRPEIMKQYKLVHTTVAPGTRVIQLGLGIETEL